MSTVNCPSCKATTSPGAQFCESCGATLGATTANDRTVINQDLPVIPPSVWPKPTGTQVGPINWDLMPPPQQSQRELTKFVLDISGSMASIYDGSLTKIQAASRASINMVLNKAKIDPQDEIGLVTFTDIATVLMSLQPIVSHKREIIQAMQSLSADGGTDINEGLKAARDQFDWSRQGVVRRIVLLTDGQGGEPLRTAEDLKSRGVVIDVIGVGDQTTNVDERLLKKVASVVQGEVRYRFIKDTSTLVEHFTYLSHKTAID